MTLSLLSPRTTQHDLLQLLFIMESVMALNVPELAIKKYFRKSRKLH